MPYVLPLVDGPVYGTPLALAFVATEARRARRSTPHGPIASQAAATSITIGPFTIEFIRVTHSMPDCVAVAMRTPQGVLLHTGDFKIDQTPLDGEPFDLHRFAQLGAEGVLAMFCDSTNIDRRGYTGSETDVEDAFEEIFTSTEGKIVVAAFSSSLYRMQIIVDLAAQFDRKVAFVGRGMNENSQIAQRLGYLHVPTGVVDQGQRRAELSRRRTCVCLVTGSQGEAERRAVADRDRRSPVTCKLRDGDRVVISARAYSRQREGDRPGDEPRRAPRRRRRHRSRTSTCTCRGTAPRKS